jgi:diguanylate cyclase (GGDEF)-like protein
VLRTAIRDLGGRVVRARLAGPDAIPVDVSLGVGEPMVVTILDPVDVSSFRLARQLPALVEDALAAARRCDDGRRQSRRASMVALNGVATRAEIDSKLQGSIHGDVVCMLGLDDLQLLNDTSGHAAGDQALADLGDLLRGGVGADDFVARCGGDEFIAILAVTSLPVARERMTRLVADWAAGPGHRPGLSLGMAPVEEGGAFVASRAAAAALRRAREPGTGRMEIATPIDHLPDGSRP